jgi:tRNA1Val (adenine37-N6)-methyltransferase
VASRRGHGAASESVVVRTTLGPDETLDAICAGNVRLIQHKNGYRFAVDSVLLGYFAGRPRGRVCDLGTGCAVIPMMLAHRAPEAHVIGVEIQEDLFRLAVRNIELNRVGEQVEVVRADLRRLQGLLRASSFDLVVSNPPYRPCPRGWISPVSERAVAKHEVECSLADVVACASYLLNCGARFKVVYPASRLGDLFSELRGHGLQPRKLRCLHPRPSAEAKLVLCEAVKGGRCDLQVLPPVVLNDDRGRCVAEAEAILGEN